MYIFDTTYYNQLSFGLNVIIIIVLLASSVWLLYLELVVIRKHTVVYFWQIGDKGVAQISVIDCRISSQLQGHYFLKAGIFV